MKYEKVGGEGGKFDLPPEKTTLKRPSPISVRLQTFRLQNFSVKIILKMPVPARFIGGWGTIKFICEETYFHLLRNMTSITCKLYLVIRWGRGACH